MEKFNKIKLNHKILFRFKKIVFIKIKKNERFEF